MTSGVSEGGVENFITDAQNSSALSFWVNAGYKNVADIKGETLSYDLGINFGYAPQGSTSRAYTQKGSVWGINP